MQLVKSSSPPTKRQGQSSPNLWWIHASSMWKLTLEMVLSLASQFTSHGKDLAHLEERKRKKKKKPKQVPHQPLQALPETPRSIWPMFYWNAILNFGLLGLGLWYRSFPTTPPRSWLLINSQQSNSCPWCHFRSLLPTPTARCTPSISVCFHFMLYFPHAQA